MTRLAPPAVRRLGLLSAAYALLTVARLAPFSLHPGTRLADDGDAAQGAWILWSAARSLGRASDLFEANAYFPHASALLYSEPLLAQAALALPILRLTGDAVLANNLVLLLCLAASALAAHLLFREHAQDDAASACGAVVYAFSTYALSHLAQLQLVSLQWLPLGLLYLRRLLRHARASDAACFAAVSALHGLSCLYYLLFYVLAVAVLCPFEPGFVSAMRRVRVLALLAGAGAACALVLGPVASSYLSLYRRFAFTGDPVGLDLAAFLLPPPDALVGGILPALPLAAGSLSHRLGLLASALAALGLLSFARARSADRAWLGFAVLGGVSALLAAGPEVFFAGRFLFRNPLDVLFGLPFFDALRAPNRFALLVTLALGYFVARGARVVFVDLAGWRRAAAGACLAALLVVEAWVPVRGTEVPWGPTLPEAYSRIAALPTGGPLAELPPRPFRHVRFTSLEALFSTLHTRPILFAKPSYYPPAMELLQWELRNFPDSRSATLLAGLGVRLALVHPHRFGPSEPIRLRYLARHDEKLPLLERFPDRPSPLWRRYALGAEELRAVPALEREGQPRECLCRTIPRESLRLYGNGVTLPRLAVDGRLDTRWTTGRTQREGHYLEVRFDRPRRLARVEVEMAYPWGEFPRNLVFLGLRGQAQERLPPAEDVWQTLALLRRLAHEPRGARLRYDLQGGAVDGVRLLIERTEEGVLGWSVPELHLYELDGAAAWPAPDR